MSKASEVKKREQPCTTSGGVNVRPVYASRDNMTTDYRLHLTLASGGRSSSCSR
jgi:hypothetical protein